MTPERFAAMFPEATLVGSTVLHREGWITQIPARLQVAVLDTRGPLQVDGYDVVGRPAEWFVPTATTLHGIRALTPIEAIVDAWARDDQWRPPPDDLEDDAPWDVLHAAFEAAGVPWPDVYATWRPEDYTCGRFIGSRPVSAT